MLNPRRKTLYLAGARFSPFLWVEAFLQINKILIWVFLVLMLRIQDWKIMLKFYIFHRVIFYVTRKSQFISCNWKYKLRNSIFQEILSCRRFLWQFLSRSVWWMSKQRQKEEIKFAMRVFSWRLNEVENIVELKQSWSELHWNPSKFASAFYSAISATSSSDFPPHSTLKRCQFLKNCESFYDRQI